MEAVHHYVSSFIEMCGTQQFKDRGLIIVKQEDTICRTMNWALEGPGLKIQCAHEIDFDLYKCKNGDSSQMS